MPVVIETRRSLAARQTGYRTFHVTVLSCILADCRLPSRFGLSPSVLASGSATVVPTPVRSQRAIDRHREPRTAVVARDVRYCALGSPSRYWH